MYAKPFLNSQDFGFLQIPVKVLLISSLKDSDVKAEGK